jgi:gluconolactonase
MAFHVKPDRTVGEGKVFFDATALIAKTKRTGNPDGMKVDKQATSSPPAPAAS